MYRFVKSQSVLRSSTVAALLAVTLSMLAAADRSYAQDQGVPMPSDPAARLDGDVATDLPVVNSDAELSAESDAGPPAEVDADPAPSEIFTTAITPDGQYVARSLDGSRSYPLQPRDAFIAQALERERAYEEPSRSQEPNGVYEQSTPVDAPAALSAAPSSYSLAAYQTGIRDQLGRGTCWAFAGVAGLEAYYRRAFGVTLNLSEQYAFHVGKAFELYPDYKTNTVPHENNSSYWGFQGNSNIVQKLTLVAVPDEASAPYMSLSDMDALKAKIPASGDLDLNSTQRQLDAFEFDTRHIPLAARNNAKYRATSYSQVAIGDRSTLNGRLETVIASGKEIVADFDLKWRWDAANNRYDYDATSSGGGHVMLIVGYDRSAGTFTIKNSWGGSTLIRVTYNFMRNNYNGGYTIGGVVAPSSDPQLMAAWIGNWNMDHDGHRGSLVIRRFVDLRNPTASATKLGNYYADGLGYDVNGKFEEGGRKMVFYVAETTARQTPGTLTGQRHELYLFSRNTTLAAGKTTWSSKPFGSQISRGVIPYTYGTGFNYAKWFGRWSMNHDGWRGTLYIETIVRGSMVSGRYVGSDGVTKTVAGTLDAANPHRLNLTIAFDATNRQPFELLFHTRTAGTISGITQWGGKNFGVVGYK